MSCFILSSLFETSSSPEEDIFEEEELEFIYSSISPSEDKHLAEAHADNNSGQEDKADADTRERDEREVPINSCWYLRRIH